MILDLENLLSDKQAITGTVASTNYYDAGAAQTPYGAKAAIEQDLGKGNKIPFLIQITSDFNTLTSLKIELEVDDNTSFSSVAVVYSKTVLLAALVAGKQINMDYIPKDTDERYFRMKYTVSGSNPSTGNITAGVTMGNQENNV